MKISSEFLTSVLDSITEHIVVIDKQGSIQFVNKSWTAFGNDNSCLITRDWHGINYIEQCEKAAAAGDQFGLKAGVGIRSVIEGAKETFYFEYPCHSPDEKRWFMMRVTSFQTGGSSYFVISHQNITERKLAEEAVANLARVDALTDLPNRRAFDEFLHGEWRRCARTGKELSLALIDIDHFKLYNDTYGHQAGDECLARVGKVLKKFANRPSDLCARYGGEEFVLVLGNSSLIDSLKLVQVFSREIDKLAIPNIRSPTGKHLTVSIGLAAITPTQQSEEREIIKQADKFLYRAKTDGRNRIETTAE